MLKEYITRFKAVLDIKTKERFNNFYKKWIKFEYLIGIVYLGNAILNCFLGRYNEMFAYIVVTIFVGVLHLKNLIIESKQKTIDAQEELINSLMDLTRVMEEHEKLKNHPLNNN